MSLLSKEAIARAKEQSATDGTPRYVYQIDNGPWIVSVEKPSCSYYFVNNSHLFLSTDL